MKKHSACLAATIFLIMALTSFASEESRDQNLKLPSVYMQLHLSDSQKVEIRKIYSKYFTKQIHALILDYRKQLRRLDRGSREWKIVRRKIRDIIAPRKRQFEKEADLLLSPNQLAKKQKILRRDKKTAEQNTKSSQPYSASRIPANIREYFSDVTFKSPDGITVYGQIAY